MSINMLRKALIFCMVVLACMVAAMPTNPTSAIVVVANDTSPPSPSHWSIASSCDPLCRQRLLYYTTYSSATEGILEVMRTYNAFEWCATDAKEWCEHSINATCASVSRNLVAGSKVSAPECDATCLLTEMAEKAQKAYSISLAWTVALVNGSTTPGKEAQKRLQRIVVGLVKKDGKVVNTTALQVASSSPASNGPHNRTTQGQGHSRNKDLGLGLGLGFGLAPSHLLGPLIVADAINPYPFLSELAFQYLHQLFYTALSEPLFEGATLFDSLQQFHWEWTPNNGAGDASTSGPNEGSSQASGEFYAEDESLGGMSEASDGDLSDLSDFSDEVYDEDASSLGESSEFSDEVYDETVYENTQTFESMYENALQKWLHDRGMEGHGGADTAASELEMPPKAAEALELYRAEALSPETAQLAQQTLQLSKAPIPPTLESMGYQMYSVLDAAGNPMAQVPMLSQDTEGLSQVTWSTMSSLELPPPAIPLNGSEPAAAAAAPQVMTNGAGCLALDSLGQPIARVGQTLATLAPMEYNGVEAETTTFRMFGPLGHAFSTLLKFNPSNPSLKDVSLAKDPHKPDDRSNPPDSDSPGQHHSTGPDKEQKTKVPEKTHVAPEKTHKAPKKTHKASPKETHKAAPKETHEAPEQTPKAPEETHKAPEKTQKSPVYTHTLPEETQKTAEKTHKAPKETHTTAGKTQKLTEEAHKTIQTAQKTSEETHKAHAATTKHHDYVTTHYTTSSTTTSTTSTTPTTSSISTTHHNPPTTLQTTTKKPANTSTMPNSTPYPDAQHLISPIDNDHDGSPSYECSCAWACRYRELYQAYGHAAYCGTEKPAVGHDIALKHDCLDESSPFGSPFCRQFFLTSGIGGEGGSQRVLSDCEPC